MTERLCGVPKCGRPHSSRGWCNLHYQRWRKGSFPGPDPSRPELRRPPLSDRLWGNVDKIANGCWVWRGTKNRKGYGQISVNGRQGRTHRVAYRLTHGEIPDGLVVRHRCDNPPCINPDHLELGTYADNSRDMVERGRVRSWKVANTHCPQGHPYDEANTYWWNGARQCKACKAEYVVRRRDRLSPGRVRKVIGEERDRLRSQATQLHRDGHTLKDIAQEIGWSIGFVRDLLGEAGATPRPRAYRRPRVEKGGE